MVSIFFAHFDVLIYIFLFLLSTYFFNINIITFFLYLKCLYTLDKWIYFNILDIDINVFFQIHLFLLFYKHMYLHILTHIYLHKNIEI